MMMFGKKAREEIRSMISKMDRITDEQFEILEKIDTIKELERLWGERDALMDDNTRLQSEYDALAAEAKRLADRAWKMEQRVQELQMMLQTMQRAGEEACRTES